MWAPLGRPGASLGVPGGLRNALGALRDGSWSLFWRKMSSKWLSEAVRARFSSILGAPDLENHSFSLGKTRISIKSTFSLNSAILGRFGLHFARPDPLPEPPGRPFGLPGPVLGPFGRSWGAPGALLGTPRRGLGRLLGAPGVHLGAGRAPQALGDPILEALGLDFRAFPAVFQASRMLSCRKNRMFARTRDPARRSLLCARRLVRSTWNLEAPPSRR